MSARPSAFRSRTATSCVVTETEGSVRAVQDEPLLTFEDQVAPITRMSISPSPLTSPTALPLVVSPMLAMVRLVQFGA